VANVYSDRRIVLVGGEDNAGLAIAASFRKEGGSVIVDNRLMSQEGAGQALIEDAGDVDILIVNIAPPQLDPASTAVANDDQWHAMFDVFVTPLYEMCTAVLPMMVKQRRGKIVVVSSIAAIQYVAGATTLAAVAGAQMGYVRELAGDVARHNIQINLIARHEPVMVGNEVRCETDAQSVATLAMFLASTRSDFITGTAVPLNIGRQI
jgi:NAD(P)-dependent dehydrogenase (short-subunit alcohol dehydrogenase family)